MKRQNTLLHRQTQVQQGQMQQLAQLVMENQQKWNDLKATLEVAEQADQPTPAVTITRVEDENADRADDSATA